MSKYIFKHEFTKLNGQKTNVTLETESEDISVIVEKFRMFLLACGFSEKIVNEYLE